MANIEFKKDSELNLTLTETEVDKLADAITDKVVARLNLKSEKPLIKGLKGLADLLQCSIGTASLIKNSGVIDDAIILDGRNVVIDKLKCIELLRKDQKKKRWIANKS